MTSDCSQDYKDALARLFALGQGRMLPGRDRLRSVLRRAGDPHLKVPSVLVGGTNGKGRLVTLLSAVLSQRYRCGAFVKPHLKSVRERWRLDDAEISPAQFVAYANEACDMIDAHRASTGEEISFFEANVLLGALLWAGEGAEIVVWEVGLGGREDACNLVDPLISIITNVQYDHLHILGSSLEEIAFDKAHIARPGRPLLLGPPRAGWHSDYLRYLPVIREVAESIGAELVAAPVDRLDQMEQSLQERQAAGPPLKLPLDTGVLLVSAWTRLGQAGFPLDVFDFTSGMASAHYRGRIELTRLDGRPVLLDAAHNPDSLRWLAKSLAGQRRPFIFGQQATKDPRDTLAALREVIEVLVPICIPVLHPCPSERIIEAAEELGIPVSLPPGYEARPIPADYPIGHVTECDPPDNVTGWIECVRHGLALSDELAPTVICGSIYNLGEILRAFEDGWVSTALPEEASS
ncbi:hypothetical protein IT575_00645 [bacterium]|nr:hypothetical protein [bacterium]